jgi:hypothetical protein
MEIFFVIVIISAALLLVARHFYKISQGDSGCGCGGGCGSCVDKESCGSHDTQEQETIGSKSEKNSAKN